MATVAGNLVNASPIGDLPVFLLALDATVVLQNGRTREIPLHEFYLGYKTFTKTAMNQARALVHVYTDGPVAVSTGAVEMGQGVNTKILQVAALVFSIPPEQVKVHPTNTLRIANTSPSAASATADLNGKATLIACEAILERLKKAPCWRKVFALKPNAVCS